MRKTKIVVEQLKHQLSGTIKYKVVQTVNRTDPEMNQIINKVDLDQIIESDENVEVIIKPGK